METYVESIPGYLKSKWRKTKKREASRGRSAVSGWSAEEESGVIRRSIPGRQSPGTGDVEKGLGGSMKTHAPSGMELVDNCANCSRRMEEFLYHMGYDVVAAHEKVSSWLSRREKRLLCGSPMQISCWVYPPPFSPIPTEAGYNASHKWSDRFVLAMKWFDISSVRHNNITTSNPSGNETAN